MTRLSLAAALAVVALAGCRSAFAPPSTGTVSRPPQPQHAATVTRDSPLRSGPHASANVLENVAAGTAVTVSDEVVRGFRRVKTADGKSGYVAREAVEIGGAAAAAPAPESPAGESPAQSAGAGTSPVGQ
jgi:SH3-like domain-containing protein